MKESIIVKLLYKTIVGRAILKLLVDPKLSVRVGKILDSRFSRCLIPGFIRKNNIDMSYFEIPVNGYSSFNDFFKRRLKEEFIVPESDTLICPCDAFLTISDINEDTVFHIKNTEYSVKELLDNEMLAEKLRGGMALIFRLTPAHYHRYVFGISGQIVGKKKIDGILHSVQPVCHEKTKVFVQNSREYIIIRSDILGNLVQMEIGALLVGKISNCLTRAGQAVRAGQEKGCFEYGGSTIVVLLEKSIHINRELLLREKIGTEIPVMLGEEIMD